MRISQCDTILNQTVLFKRQHGELKLTADTYNIISTILIILLIVYRNNHHSVILVKTNGLWLAFAFPFLSKSFISTISEQRVAFCYVKLTD